MDITINPTEVEDLDKALFKDCKCLDGYHIVLPVKDMSDQLYLMVADKYINMTTKGFTISLLTVMELSRELCCSQTPKELGEEWKDILDQLVEYEPKIAPWLVPSCIYRGGICTKDDCCGFNTNALKQLIEQVPEDVYRKCRNDKAIREAGGKS